MEISLRSHLIAGTAAVLAAGMVVAAPGLPAPAGAPSQSAAVELAALANPITAILNPLGLAFYWLADPTPLPDYPVTSPIYRAGWLFDLVLPHPNLAPPASLSLPVIQQVTKNVFDYASTTVELELGAAQTLVTGVLNAPAGVTTAFLQLLDSQFDAALQTLYGTLIDPVVQAVTLAAAGLLYPIRGVINRGAAAIAATVGLVASTVKSVIDNTGLVFTALTNTVDELIFNLGKGDFEKAWNTAVGGFLGSRIPYDQGVSCGDSDATCRASVPAQLVRSTVGGLSSYPVQTNPQTWSIRWALAEGGQNVARALATPLPLPVAAQAPTPAAVTAAAAEPATQAPADQVPPVGLAKADVVEAAGDGGPPAPAPTADGAGATASANAPAEEAAGTGETASRNRAVTADTSARRASAERGGSKVAKQRASRSAAG